MRRWYWLGVLSILAGCGGSSPPGGSPVAVAPPAAVSVGMVTDVGGVGDLSFNMMAKKGLDRAETELGFKPAVVESSQVADYAPNLQRLAEKGCKVVFAIGFALAPAVKEIAPRYPQVHFAIIDSEEPRADNVTNLTFREEEGSLLVGALAGGMSKTGTLGFVGGMEIPLIKRFEAGFRAGVRTTNPAAGVVAKYTNTWDDVAKGKELALSLFGQEADVVMHASGRCGIGVIEAAKQRGPGFWAIGVDADQDYLGTDDHDNPKPPSRVLTSMMKRVDNAVFAVCREAATGTVNPGPREFGVKEEGVGTSPLTYTREQIPAALLKKVDRLRAMLADGALKAPRTLEDLESWKAPDLR